MFDDPYYYRPYAEWLASPDIFERESSSGFIKILNALDRDIVAAEAEEEEEEYEEEEEDD